MYAALRRLPLSRQQSIFKVKMLEKVLCLRPCDFTRFSHFGFLLTETPAERRQELDRMAHSTLLEYIS